MADNKLTILYSRLSREDENNTGESLSIENQKKLLEDYAITNGFSNIVHIFDDGISGSTFNREGMNKAVEEIDKGNVAIFVCKDVSRLSRSIVDTTLFLEKLQEKNVRFIAISDNEDSEKGISDMLMFRSLFNEFYAKDCSKKQRAIKQNQAKNGIRTNSSVPYGYIIDPENKNHLIPDIEVKDYVIKIYDMFVSGEKICDIQRYLLENKAITPKVLAYNRSANPNPKFADNLKIPYNWDTKTIYGILQNLAYTGCLVTNQSHNLSYKSKKRIMNSPEERFYFPNAHEALISKGTFELAEKRLESRTRPCKIGEIDPYSGLIFCGDCGHKLNINRGKNRAENAVHYVCGAYRCGVQRQLHPCTTHYIRKIVLDELVLSDLNRIAESIKKSKQKFIENALKYAENKDFDTSKSKKKEYEKSKKRLAELDKIFKKLYEDRVLERITDEQFSDLTADFQIEKQNLKEIINSFENEKSESEKKKQDINKFIKIVDKYTEFTELNYEILHELIDRIKIYEVDKVNKIRKVEVIYKFIGAVTPTAPPVSHECFSRTHSGIIKTIIE
jgi:DNA invertase Pin-like site-specific DNA recombinase